jgi:ketosteroid isomerase-like protein
LRATGNGETRRQAETAPEVRVVEEWHEALNAGDAERLVALSHPDVRVGGPRGTGRGAGLLREWVARANIRLQPRRVFQREETVVLEEEAEWRSPETGEVIGASAVGSVFVVRGGRVASIERYDDLAGALDAAGLGKTRETRPC